RKCTSNRLPIWFALLSSSRPIWQVRASDRSLPITCTKGQLVLHEVTVSGSEIVLMILLVTIICATKQGARLEGPNAKTKPTDCGGGRRSRNESSRRAP